MSWIHSALPRSPAYEAASKKLAAGWVLLDGGVATALSAARASSAAARREPWGDWILYSAETEVLSVHRGYAAAGCDVLSTNSWSILQEAEAFGADGPPSAWEEAADAALGLARRAAIESPRGDDCAVAFCINGDLEGPRALGALELLTWRWRERAPDLVIFETLTALPGARFLEAVDTVVELGLPVWVSMRRGPAGMASVEGEVTPDEDPARLPRTVRELEAHGVSALLVNCVPRRLLPETLTALGAVTSLPLGCLPNLGRPRAERWERDDRVTPEQYAEEARAWLERGARIIGGCCGVGPEHIAALDEIRATALSEPARDP